MAKAIEWTRVLCEVCVRSAPSQPSMPPTEMVQPEYPFQMLAADYFDYAGHCYLVVVDRYSGWPCVSKCREESAEELVRLLRVLFCTYRVPAEFASDGASLYGGGDEEVLGSLGGSPADFICILSPQQSESGGGGEKREEAA